MEVTVSRPGGEKDVRKSREQMILAERVIEVFFWLSLMLSALLMCVVFLRVCVALLYVCVCSGPVLHWLLQTHLTAC